MIGNNLYFMNDTARGVMEIQKWLRTVSRTYPQIPSVFIDGIYGAETRSAIKAFQKLVGLPVTGITDSATFAILFSTYLDLLIPDSELIGLRDILSLISNPISSGEQSDTVYHIQAVLRNIAVLDNNLMVELTGIYDKETEEAIKLLQRLFGRNDDGIVTADLLRDIIRLNTRIME